ncbi:flagellar assembly protein FliH [Rhodocyclaceae bacterium SMB388]
MTVTRHQAVGAYQRWRPESFDERTETDPAVPGEPAAKADTPPVAPAAEPPPHAAAAEPMFALPTAEEIERMYEHAHDEGYQAGFDEGRSAGLADGQAEVRQQADRLAELVRNMDAALDLIDGDIAQEVAALAVAIARQVVRHTLADHPTTISETVREALQQLPQGKARIRIHPDDAALVREYLEDQLEQGHHTLVEDDGIHRGGCRLESAGCEIDATVETRWRRVLQGMGRTDTDWENEA